MEKADTHISNPTVSEFIFLKSIQHRLRGPYIGRSLVLRLVLVGLVQRCVPQVSRNYLFQFLFRFIRNTNHLGILLVILLL